MTATETQKTAQGTSGEPVLVVNPAEEGFDVYEPSNPARVYRVTGSAAHPACTCTDFAWKQKDPGYRCDHILAVLRHLGRDENGKQVASDSPRQTGSQRTETELPGDPAQTVLMTLKRSVSPDGRINSLSIEFSLPVDMLAQDLEINAFDILDRQEQIATEYLDRHGNGNAGNNQSGEAGNGRPEGGGPVPATLRDVGGMQTRYGWRYFINVEAGRQSYKLFGTQQQLRKQLAALGQDNARLSKGVVLDLPCLAVLEESEDGRYTNVVELLPRDGQRAGRR